MWKAFALILFFSLTLCAQEAKETLYSRGLKACLEKEVEAYSKFTARDLYNVIVVDDSKITEDLPTQFGKINVAYLRYEQLAQKFKSLPKQKDKDKERARIPVIRMFPIRDEGNKLFFGYGNYWFDYAEKGGFFSGKKFFYNFALEGGCHAEIGFDSTGQKFIIEEVNLWGI
jgi:hypothetical protein